MLSNHEGLKPNGILKMRRVSSFAAKTSLFLRILYRNYSKGKKLELLKVHGRYLKNPKDCY